MGRGVIESGLFRTEQLQLEQRTADPTSPEPNEEWLRVDIKPTYEDADGVSQTGVAEYRRANSSGTIETAPVATLGDSTNADVIDKIRAYVDTGGSPTGTGFIPHATSGAAYPHKRLQHPTDGQAALHDSLTANAIPDSGDLHAHFDATALSLADGDPVSTWTDESGNGNGLTAGDAPTFQNGAINGNPAVRFNGSSNYLDVSFSALSQPVSIFAVFQLRTQDPSQFLFDGDVSSGRLAWFESTGSVWTVFGGKTVPDSADRASSNTNNNILSGFYNTTSSSFYVNGALPNANYDNIDVGANSLEGLTVGSDLDAANFGAYDVGEILVYPQDKSSIQSDVESYLSSKWGITT